MAATYTARNDGMRGGTVERAKALEVALLQIEKQFGKGSVMRMGIDGPADPVQAISTGSLALDLALGIGGVPRGRVVEIYGPEASGKTTLALHIIAEAQRAGGIAAFIDAEHALDVTYARNLGVNTDELLISQPDTGEQALEIADMLIRSGAIDVIVIDSVAALVPRAEIEGEMGDSHVGLQARLMSQALRKLSGSISKSKTTAIFINQLREKIGVLFGCFHANTRVTLANPGSTVSVFCRRDFAVPGRGSGRDRRVGGHQPTRSPHLGVGPGIDGHCGLFDAGCRWPRGLDGATIVAVAGQVGNGTQRSRSSASRNWCAHGQRVGRCRCHRRAEWVSRPGRPR
jgi:RecA/RadA recombinase